MKPLGKKKDFLSCHYGCCLFRKAAAKQKCLKAASRRANRIRIILVKI